jgi:hypothetical protein
MSAATEKPRFRIVANVPVRINAVDSKIDNARRRFGRPFAHESGTNRKPRETPLLAEWMAGRIQEKG